MISRKGIYLIIFIVLSIPLIFGYSITPARMKEGDRTYDLVQGIFFKPGQVALVSLDFGPSTKAENLTQAEVLVEHLMRRRIPILLTSLTPEASGFLDAVPEGVVARLKKEGDGTDRAYGVDWVNLGFMAGGYIAVQALPKVQDLASHFKRDVKGNRLSDLPIFNGVKTIRDIPLLVEITASVGLFEYYVQFFQSEGFRPTIIHGCTSIMTPDRYTYLDSGQLQGLLEGIGGAAWYSHRLKEENPGREADISQRINTGLGIAHLAIMLLVLIGNFGFLFAKESRR